MAGGDVELSFLGPCRRWGGAGGDAWGGDLRLVSLADL